LAILHCVSGYPALASEYNLKTIPDMISRFGLVTGLSDHTLDNTTAIASIALGASIVEKHFTLSRKGGGPDDSFSLEPQELANLCEGCKTAWSAMGSINYAEKGSEVGSMKHRRSLYFVRDLKSGDIITPENVKSIRPGMGLSPKYYDSVIGRKVLSDVTRGTPVHWDKVE
jgi:sialic acid synthase SpsE